MKTNSPMLGTWIIAAILGVAGLLGALGVIPTLAGFAFWLVFVGLGLMLLATTVKGL
jgi:hypothetical protein